MVKKNNNVLVIIGIILLIFFVSQGKLQGSDTQAISPSKNMGSLLNVKIIYNTGQVFDESFPSILTSLEYNMHDRSCSNEEETGMVAIGIIDDITIGAKWGGRGDFWEGYSGEVNDYQTWKPSIWEYNFISGDVVSGKHTVCTKFATRGTMDDDEYTHPTYGTAPDGKAVFVKEFRYNGNFYSTIYQVLDKNEIIDQHTGCGYTSGYNTQQSIHSDCIKERSSPKTGYRCASGPNNQWNNIEIVEAFFEVSPTGWYYHEHCEDIYVMRQADIELIASVPEMQAELTQAVLDAMFINATLQQKLFVIEALNANLTQTRILIEQMTNNLTQQVTLIKELDLTIADQIIMLKISEATILENAELIQLLNLTIADQAQMMHELNLTVKDQAKLIISYNLTIENQLIFIKELSANIIKKQEFITNFTAENEYQAALIIGLGASVETQADLINGLNNTITEDAVLINALNLSVEDQAELLILMNLTLGEQAQLIKRLTSTNEEAAEMIGLISENLEEAKLMIEKITNDAEAKEKLLRDVLKSQDEALKSAQQRNWVVGGIAAIAVIYTLTSTRALSSLGIGTKTATSFRRKRSKRKRR